MIATVAEVTQVMRDADAKFKSVGGSTRHYVRDLLIPMMEDAGLLIISVKDAPIRTDIDQLEIKKAIAVGLRSKGYSIRQIMKALNYKSPRSITELLKTK